MTDKEIHKNHSVVDEDNERQETAFEQLLSFVFLIGFFWLAYALIRWLAKSIMGVAERIQHTAADPFVAFTVGIAVLVFGALLYLFRERYRKIYAIGELAVASIVAAEVCYRYGADTTNPAFLITLLGSLYIAVRGFDNFAKAREESFKRSVKKHPVS